MGRKEYPFNTRNLYKLLALILAMCIGILGCFGSYYRYGGSQKENLKLRFKQCQDPGPYQGIEILNTEWVDDNELNIVFTADSNCADSFWSGDYRIEDQTNLILVYHTHRVGSMAACICPVELSYTISDLEKLNYDIIIEEGDLIIE